MSHKEVMQNVNSIWFQISDLKMSIQTAGYSKDTPMIFEQNEHLPWKTWLLLNYNDTILW